MARIELQKVAHSYLARPAGEEDFAVKELDLTWDDGGAYALLGPSGCGKTTLLNIISGLLTPSRGQVVFDGRDVTQERPEQRNIAQVFQFPVIYDTMTVRQNLAFPLKNRRVPDNVITARVAEIARMIDLENVLDRKARNLSADQKQKISLGRGLVRSDVNAILFDEPLTVIDPHLKWQLRSQLKKLHREFAFTMVYVTHDQTEALTFADKVVVMYEGEVVQIGTPEDLFERPMHTFVGYFIGSPGMNVAPVSIEGNRAILGGHAIELARFYPDAPVGATMELGTRPEFIRFAENGGARDGEGLPVTVKRVDDIGRFKVAKVELAGVSLAVVADEDTVIDGDEARIVFDPDHVHIYADSQLVEGVAQ
jgi:glycerol transport system ATP-binding protein